MSLVRDVEIMSIADFTKQTEKSLTPFWQANLLDAIVYSLLILSIVFFMFYPWTVNVASYMRQSKGPFVFFPVFATAAVVYAYLNLRCGKGEFVVITAHVDAHNETLPPVVSTEEARPVFGYALPIFFLHTLWLLLPALPIYLLATAVSGLPFTACWAGIGLIFALALCARLIGFLLLLLFGRGSLFAYFLSRTLLALLLFATILTGSAYNPLRCLYDLHVGVTPAWSWNDAYWRCMTLITASLPLLAFLCYLQQKWTRKNAAQLRQPTPRRQRFPKR